MLPYQRHTDKDVSIKFYKLVTLFLVMAKVNVFQAQIQRELDQLAKEIFEIDFKIQSFTSQSVIHTS